MNLMYALLLPAIMSTCSGKMVREKLTKDLLANYVKSVKPDPTNGSDFEVQFEFSLLSLDHVDVTHKMIEIHSYIDYIWKDERLAWNPSDYENVQKLHLSTDSIWIPDVVLLNNAGDDYKPMIDMRVFVFSDGTVHYAPPYHLKSVCEKERGIPNLFSNDPVRELECQLKFLSWLHDEDEMHLVNSKVNVNWSNLRYYPSADTFDVKMTYVNVHPKNFPCCLKPYDIATVTIIVSNAASIYAGRDEFYLLEQNLTEEAHIAENIDSTL